MQTQLKQVANTNYYADTKGNIYSDNKKVPAYRCKNGYKVVNLKIDGKRKTALLHRLVARAFYGEIPEKYTVNHKDFNKTNNNINNLEYVSYSDNQKHNFRARKIDLSANTRRKRVLKLTEEQLPKLEQFTATPYDNVLINEKGEIYNQLTKHYITPYKQNLGAYQIRVNENGIRKSVQVSRLMVETFLKPSGRFWVKFADGNKANLQLSNLMVKTIKEEVVI